MNRATKHKNAKAGMCWCRICNFAVAHFLFLSLKQARAKRRNAAPSSDVLSISSVTSPPIAELFPKSLTFREWAGAPHSNNDRCWVGGLLNPCLLPGWLIYFFCEAALDADTIMSGMDAVLLQYEFAEEGPPTLLHECLCVAAKRNCF